MAVDTTDYKDKAQEKAADAVRDCIDDIVEQLIDRGEASDDLLNDYGSYGEAAEQDWTDEWYNPQEAVKCLDDLDDHEETDSGLWDGKGWKEMLSAIAAFTFRNGCMSFWQELIKQINDDIDADELKNEIRDAVKAEKMPDIESEVIAEFRAAGTPLSTAGEEIDKRLEAYVDDEGEATIAERLKTALTEKVKAIADEYHT